MPYHTIHTHDVLIIGGGLTGLRAALQIATADLDVALISKVHPLRSHSVAAQGGINAALGNVPGKDGTQDSWEGHARDTIKGSDYLADQDAVALLCQEGPKSVYDLDHMGTVWSRLDDGKIAQRPFGGAGFPRTCYTADRTGHNILHTLYEQILDQKISMYEDTFVCDLVIDRGICTGCTGIEIMTGAVTGWAAKAVLLATGGFGRIYGRSTNALINTADGQAMAFRAGAQLKDMEFVQFHPTTLFGTNILISEAARGEGGILLNKDGERFMARYAPSSLDLAPRDVVARAIETEISTGRGFDGGYVHLDLRHLGEERIREKLPGIRQIAMEFAGVDPVRDPIPVQPGQHYSMGGVDTDLHGSTVLPRLYAAGECACISVHGANRLGGNSLLETVVFGRLVADAIIRDLKADREVNTRSVLSAMEEWEIRIERILTTKGEERLHSVLDELKETMLEHFGIFRDAAKMERGYAKIRVLQDRFSRVTLNNKERAVNQALIRYLELEGMLQVAEVVALGAIAREESRGSHMRTDFPGRDDARFMNHTLAKIQETGISISYIPVTGGMMDPEERVY